VNNAYGKLIKIVENLVMTTNCPGAYHYKGISKDIEKTYNDTKEYVRNMFEATVEVCQKFMNENK
jgi:hypothetical protein